MLGLTSPGSSNLKSSLGCSITLECLSPAIINSDSEHFITKYLERLQSI